MTDKRPLTASDLYRLYLISDPQISPDGSRIAFVQQQLDEEKNDYITNVYVVNREGVVVQFTSGGKDTTPRWSPDGRYLAFLSGRKEKAQIHLLPTTGGESVAATDRKLGAGVPVWSPDSTTIAFIGMVSTEGHDDDTKDGAQQEGKEKPAPTKTVDRASYKLDGAGYLGNRRSHVFLLGVEDHVLTQLTDGDYFDDHPAWSPDGQHLAFSSNRREDWDVSLESDIFLIPAGGGQPRALVSGGSFVQPVFSPDGSRVAFIGHPEAKGIFAPARLYSVDRAGQDCRDELGDWDGALGNDVLSDVVHSGLRNQVPLHWEIDGLVFIGTEHGESNIYRTAEGSVHPVTSGRHTVTDFSLAGHGSLAYACADATHPAEVFLRRDGETTQLTHQNEAFLAEVMIVPPERICFQGANGESSDGWLLRPPQAGSGKYPLIVYIHGGPMLAHGEAIFFEYQFLAGQGFGVFYPNIHGSASYGRAYQVSIKESWGGLDYQDVLAGTEVAAAQPWVDRQRLGIAGGSYGGYLTSWVMGHTERFRAAVAERCVSNLVSFMGTSDSGWAWNREFGAYPEEDVQKLWDMSPIKYVANVQAPMLVMHSERDDRTPLEQGEQLFNALRRLGKTSRFIVFPEESHGLSRGGKPSRRVERLGYIRDWFKEHL